MAGIKYRLYEDRDAEQVMSLFRRNRFYLGKRPADVEDFRYSWRARGGILAAVGETEDGQIIAYAAVYPTGDGIVCAPHQLVMGGLLVDESYRLHLYSLNDMYRLLLREILRMPWITTLISEVDDYRRQSLLFQRHLGSVMLNGVVPSAEHIYIMYNFGPSIKHMFDPASAGCQTPIMTLMPKVDKRRAYERDAVRDGRFVDAHYRMPNGNIQFSIHIPTGLVCGIEMEGEWSAGVEEDFEHIFIRFLHSDGRAVVQSKGAEEILLTEQIALRAGEIWRRRLPEGTEKVHLSIDGDENSYWFEPAAMKQCTHRDRPPVHHLGRTVFDPETGILTVSDRFSVPWPMMDMPYLTGTITPRCIPGLTVEQTDENVLTARVCDKCGETVRQYRMEGNRIRIHTWHTATGTSELHPLFQLIMQDRQMTCVFDAGNPDSREVRLDIDRDLKVASPEIPYILLGEQKGEARPVKSIQLRFADENDEICLERPARAWLQFEYLTMEPCPVQTPGGVYDFGEMIITRLEQSDGIRNEP